MITRTRELPRWNGVATQTPEGWDEIPVHPEMRPDRDSCRHCLLAHGFTCLLGAGGVVAISSACLLARSSSQPVLDSTNYVLIRGDEFSRG